MKESRLEAYAPVGINLKQEISWIRRGYILSALFSLLFLLRLNDAYQNLFHYVGAQKVLKRDGIMPDFITLLDNTMAGFVLVAICMIALAAYHYFYHYQGSKSIYLMRRLPKSSDLHRRCLTIPALAAISSLALALLLTFIYFGTYLLVVPQGYLPAQGEFFGLFKLGEWVCWN